MACVATKKEREVFRQPEAGRGGFNHSSNDEDVDWLPMKYAMEDADKSSEGGNGLNGNIP